MNTSASSKMTKSTAAAAPKATAEKKTVAAKVEKKTEAPKAEVKAAAPKVEKKATAAPVVAAQAVAEAAPAVPEITWNEELKTLQTTVEAQITTLKSVLANLKRVEKRVAKEIKEARKKRKVARKENADGTPAVVPFQIPIPVSDELGVFLGKGKGATASRSEVTKFISAYIKQKGLGQKHNIKPDATLVKLLSITPADAEKLTYFNLQTHLKKHYIKTA